MIRNPNWWLSMFNHIVLLVLCIAIDSNWLIFPFITSGLMLMRNLGKLIQDYV